MDKKDFRAIRLAVIEGTFIGVGALALTALVLVYLIAYLIG